MNEDLLPFLEEGKCILSSEVLDQCWALTRETADRDEFDCVLRIWAAISKQVYDSNLDDPTGGTLRQHVMNDRKSVRRFLETPMFTNRNAGEAGFIQTFLQMDSIALGNIRSQVADVDARLAILEEFLIGQIKTGAPSRQVEKEYIAIQLAHVWQQLSGRKRFGEPFRYFIELLFEAALGDTRNLDRISRNAIGKYRCEAGKGRVYLRYMSDKGRNSEI